MRASYLGILAAQAARRRIAGGSGGGGEPEPFDYAAFLSGKTGDAWLAAGVTHYQDTARTTPAGNGNPVGSMTGSGAQFNAQQATSGARPTLNISGDIAWFGLDGGDRNAAGTNSSWNFLHNGTEDGYICGAVRFGTTANPDLFYVLCSTFTNGTGFLLGYDDRSSLSRNDRANYAALNSGALALGITSDDDELLSQTDAIIEIIKDAADVTMYVNGVYVASDTLSSPSSGNSDGALFIGSTANSSFNMAGRNYALLVCNAIPDSTTRAAILADMAARCETPPTLP